MKPLILTSSSGLGSLSRSDFADGVIGFAFRFVWGPLPPPAELATCLSARSDKDGSGLHWSDYVGRWPKSSPRGRRDLALVDFCQPYDVIELWFDPAPNDQLHLTWLLDHLCSFPDVVAKLRLRLVDFDLLIAPEEMPEESDVPYVDVTERELETARAAWQAYRAPTPEACFNLLRKDLSALPLLRPALLDLIDELPCSETGLGATEMRFLELIANGYDHLHQLRHPGTLRRRPLFDEIESGFLLEGLAHGPRPAVAGLDDRLRTLEREDCAGRHAAFVYSRLSLTEFGRAIVAYKEDFSRHNPIERWWGGTRLTSERLWRLDPVLTAPDGRRA